MRKKRERLSKTLGRRRQVMIQLKHLLQQLLLEQRVQDHGRRARIFQPANAANLLRQRRGRRDQRSPQFHSQVIGRQINHRFS